MAIRRGHDVADGKVTLVFVDDATGAREEVTFDHPVDGEGVPLTGEALRTAVAAERDALDDGLRKALRRRIRALHKAGDPE
jgi:hypothetical protein